MKTTCELRVRPAVTTTEMTQVTQVVPTELSQVDSAVPVTQQDTTVTQTQTTTQHTQVTSQSGVDLQQTHSQTTTVHKTGEQTVQLEVSTPGLEVCDVSSCSFGNGFCQVVILVIVHDFNSVLCSSNPKCAYLLSPNSASDLLLGSRNQCSPPNSSKAALKT